MYESYYTYEWVILHSRLLRRNYTYEWVMSHIWMSHVAHINESCNTYEWVMLHIRMSHVTLQAVAPELATALARFDMTASTLSLPWVKRYVPWIVNAWRDSFTCAMTFSLVTWLLHMCDMTYLYSTCLLPLSPCHGLKGMCHDSFTRDVTHSHVPFFFYTWHVSFTCVIWHIHIWHACFHSLCSVDEKVCAMTRSRVTWLIHMWHDSSICAMTHSHVKWPIHMRDLTHSYLTWLPLSLFREWKGTCHD